MSLVRPPCARTLAISRLNRPGPVMVRLAWLTGCLDRLFEQIMPKASTSLPCALLCKPSGEPMTMPILRSEDPSTVPRRKPGRPRLESTTVWPSASRSPRITGRLTAQKVELVRRCEPSCAKRTPRHTDPCWWSCTIYPSDQRLQVAEDAGLRSASALRGRSRAPPPPNASISRICNVRTTACTPSTV